MIMTGKVFLAFIWTFWLIASGSIADGITLGGKKVTEYNPTYSTTYDRVIARGNLICGTMMSFQASLKKYGLMNMVIYGQDLMLTYVVQLQLQYSEMQMQ